MSEKRIHEEYTKLGPIRFVYVFVCCVCASDDRTFGFIHANLATFSPTTVEITKEDHFEVVLVAESHGKMIFFSTSGSLCYSCMQMQKCPALYSHCRYLKNLKT